MRAERGGAERAVVVALVAVVAVLAGGATLAVAHGNHVAVNPQVIDDEGVLVESTFISQGGHVVVHRVEDGEPGEPIGHATVEQGYHENLQIELDDRPSGETTLWLVLHEDDGDGEFDPADDPPLESFGSVAGTRVPVSVGDRPVFLSAPSESSQTVEDGAVRIARVAAAEEGRVVVRTVDGGQPGEVVGSAPVSAGVSENVSVPLEESYLQDSPDYFGAYVMLVAGDGESFESSDYVTVGGDPVMTRLSLQQGGGDGGPDVNVATTEGGDDGSDGDSAGLPLPGFGAGLAVAVVVGLLAVAVRRRD